MSYRFISSPKYVEPKMYERTIAKIVKILKNEPSVVSIYRLGNVNHPGISDIDLVVIFRDEQECMLNIHLLLEKQEHYLLTHEIGGIQESKFKEVYNYTFWDNLTCIWGKNHIEEWSTSVQNKIHKEDYKEQIALEFLVKNFLEITVQRKYGVIKKRTLLQEVKGVRYDIAFLKLQGGVLEKKVNELLDKMDGWFKVEWQEEEISLWLDEYYEALKNTINELSAANKKLWIPQKDNYKYGRNVHLRTGNQFLAQYKGIFLPSWLIAQHKKLYNAHLRLNSFEIEVDFTSEDLTNMNKQRFKLIQDCKKYNQEHLPYFGTLLSSLANYFV